MDPDSTPKPRSALLSLPTELRLKILRHLLTTPTPNSQTTIQWMDDATASTIPEGESIGKILWYQISPSSPFTPAILACNRQLHAEGLPLLYGNTFTFTLPVGRRLDAGQAVIFMGGLELRPSAVVELFPCVKDVRRWRFEINVDPALKRQRIDGWHYRYIRKMVEELKEVVPDRLLSVDVDLSFGGDREYRDDQARHMTHAFGLLRADKVSVVGVPEEFAGILERVITGHEEVVDLRREYEDAAFDDRETGPWRNIATLVRHRLLMLTAMLDWDVVRFERLKRARDVLAGAETVDEYNALIARIDPQSASGYIQP